MDSKTFLFVIPIFLVLLAIHLIPDSEAKNQSTTRYPIISIQYSEGCQRMIENNINTTCPQLSQLVQYDTSNKMVSGQFIVKEGKTIRTNPEFKNHWLYYTKQTVCVVCDLDLAQPDLFKTIFIEPSSFTFINKAENSTNHKFISYSNRYVSPDCLTSTIGYSDKLLNDTISYLESNCTKTNIQTNQTNTIQDTPFSYDNPFSSLIYKNQISQIKHDGMKNCITQKCDIKDPYKKKGW